MYSRQFAVSRSFWMNECWGSGSCLMKFSIFFFLFSCLTAYSSYSRKLLPGASLKCYDKNLSGIILNFSYLDMRDEKGQSGSAHGRRGERKRRRTLMKLQYLRTPQIREPQKVLIRRLRLKSAMLPLHTWSVSAGNELPPVEDGNSHGLISFPATCPTMFRKDCMLSFLLLDVSLRPPGVEWPSSLRADRVRPWANTRDRQKKRGHQWRHGSS